MTALSDNLALIALLFGMVVLWVVLGRLILNTLTGKVVQQYETLDNDPGTISWRRRSIKRKRAA